MSIFGELSRRNVIRVGIAYVVAGWLVLQVADIVLENIGAPAWVIQAIMLLLALGFPIVMIFSWAYEVTPDGIKRESEIDRSQSITNVTGGKLNNVITILLVVALGYFIWESRIATPRAADPVEVTDAAEVEDAAASFEAIQTDTPSIAVLPFENRSDRKEDEFFVEGMHDDLLTSIAKIGSLKVISRTSVMEYAGVRDKKISEIARELGVANILEGGIQRAGNKVRINMQLIRAETDEHLWAENYDRELTIENLFDIQSEIAKAVAEALHAALSPDEQRRIETAATNNLDAYDAYLRGRQLMATREVVPLQESVDELRRDVELDSQFALAWVGLADAVSLMAVYGDEEPSDYYSVREEAINTALEIDPDLGEAYASLGALLDDQELVDDSEQAYRRAIELSPNYATAYHWLSNSLGRSFRRSDEALVLAQKAQNFDPRSAIIGVNLAAAYHRLGDYDAAVQEARRVLQFDPGYAGAHRTLGNLNWDSGGLGQAYLDYATASRLDPASVGYQSNVAFALFSLGGIDEAAPIISSMQETAADSVDTKMILAYAGVPSGADISEQLLALRQSKNRYVRMTSGDFSAVIGDELAARDAFMSVVEQDLQEPAAWPKIIDEFNFSSCFIAWALKRAGDQSLGEEFAKAALREFQELSASGIDHVDIIPLDACYLTLGDIDASLTHMEMQLEHGHYADWSVLHAAPIYDQIRENPRYIVVHEQFQHELARQRELAGL